MSTLQVLSSSFVNFSTDNPRNWAVSSSTANQIVFRSGTDLLTLQGNFTFDAAGNASGTVTTVFHNILGVGNTPDDGSAQLNVYRATGLSLDAKTFVPLVDNAKGDAEI